MKVRFRVAFKGSVGGKVELHGESTNMAKQECQTAWQHDETTNLCTKAYEIMKENMQEKINSKTVSFSVYCNFESVTRPKPSQGFVKIVIDLSKTSHTKVASVLISASVAVPHHAADGDTPSMPCKIHRK